MKALFCGLTVCLLGFRVCGQLTNAIPPNVFLTDDGKVFWYKSGTRLVDSSKIRSAIGSPESRPAEMDLAGHWGIATNGFQLSLRLKRKEYAVGEPIQVITLMRNVSDQKRKYSIPIHIQMMRDNSPVKLRNDTGIIESSGLEVSLFPQTQGRQEEGLDQVFLVDAPGLYTIQARCFRPEVSSQRVEITVTNRPSVSNATETNNLFLTDDGFLSVNRAKKVEDAKKSRESLPAIAFPEGNWGATTNGFQLSLRFEKATYAPGEPIEAILLLRNVTNTVLKYRVASMSNQDGPIGLVVSNANGIIKPIATDPMVIVSSRDVPLSPFTQHKYVERLDKRFDLKKPGQYTIHARFGIGCPNCVELLSANTQIEIRD